MDDEALLREQVEYYRARAGEYDEWFFRRGRYDRGPAHRDAWLAEISMVESALLKSPNAGDVLELACGTGLWTRELASRPAHIVAVDASPEVIAINRARVNSDQVEYVVDDLFSWMPATGAFDLVFFAFWLSHVPAAKFEAFWSMVRSALTPGGRVFFVDSQFESTSTALNHEPLDRSGVVTRKLNDGREFSVVKMFYEPAELEQRLRDLDWNGHVRSTGQFFLYGEMRPAQ